MNESSKGGVRRRRVHYFSGFDPRGAAHYHRLFKEEAAKPQPLGGVINVGRRRKAGKIFSQWPVEWRAHADQPSAEVSTEHVFMSWDDIIRAHWSRSPWMLWLEFWRAYTGIVRDVDLRKVKAIFRSVYLTGILPALFLGLTLLCGLLIASGIWALGAPWNAGGTWALYAWTALSALAGTAWIYGAWTYGAKKGVFWLLRIFHYVILLGRGQVKSASQRTQEWVEFIIERQQVDPVDEVLLVGHSIGTLMMVDTVDALLKDPRWEKCQAERKTQVLTLGQCYPFVAMVPQAEAFRATLARLSHHPQLLWWDVTAKIDPLCFYRAHPLVKTGVAYANAPMPILHAAGFFRMYTPATWKSIRKDKLQAHFLYLLTPEKAGNFHLYDVLYGPKRFEDQTKDERSNA